MVAATDDVSRCGVGFDITDPFGDGGSTCEVAIGLVLSPRTPSTTGVETQNEVAVCERIRVSVRPSWDTGAWRPGQRRCDHERTQREGWS